MLDEPSSQPHISETASAVPSKASKNLRSKHRSRAAVEHEDINENAAADQEREVFEPRRTRSGMIVDAHVSGKSTKLLICRFAVGSILQLLLPFVAHERAGVSDRTTSASAQKRKLGKEPLASVEQRHIEEKGAAEDERAVLPPRRTRSEKIAETARTEPSGSVSLPSRSTRSSKRNAPEPSEMCHEDLINTPTVNKTSHEDRDSSLRTTIEVEESSAVIAKNSTKVKGKKHKSRQDDSSTPITAASDASRVEVQDQGQRKKLRSHGVDIVEEQESGGPSVAPAKDKRTKRKWADSTRGEEESAAELYKAKVSAKFSIWPLRIWVLSVLLERKTRSSCCTR